MFIRKTLHNQMVRAKEREITKLRDDLRIANHNNEVLVKENLIASEANKDLRFENDEQKDFITRIDKLVNSNKYSNEKAILDKIKELISDYQSIN